MTNSIDTNIAASPGGIGRILFVDDEELFGSMGSRLLERQGYQVTFTTDSEAALKHFAYRPADYDLVITGQTLSRMSGTELTDKLLKIRPDIPVFLCTAVETLTAEMARRRGIREFMAKPLDSELFAMKVRTILEEKLT